MTEKLEIYFCPICGNLVQVLVPANGTLVCCGEEMMHLTPQTQEGELGEKHIPTIETEHGDCQNGICTEKTFVRLNHHPMIKEHYIQLIEVIKKDHSELRLKYLNPDEKAEFEITGFNKNIRALEFCNIHGLWENKND